MEMKKVILISIDGMRPDGLKACGNPYLSKLEKSVVIHMTRSRYFLPLRFRAIFL